MRILLIVVSVLFLTTACIAEVQVSDEAVKEIVSSVTEDMANLQTTPVTEVAETPDISEAVEKLDSAIDGMTGAIESRSALEEKVTAVGDKIVSQTDSTSIDDSLENLDKAIKELADTVSKQAETSARISESVDSLAGKVEESSSTTLLDSSISELQKSVLAMSESIGIQTTSDAELEAKIDALAKEVMDIEKVLASANLVEKQYPEVEEVFADVFTHATKVDVITSQDICDGNLFSTLDVAKGDQIHARILYVHNEEQGLSSQQSNLDFYIYYPKNNDTYEFRLTDSNVGSNEIRTISNPWNDSNNPYKSVLYESSITLKEAGFKTPYQSETNPNQIEYHYSDAPWPGKYVIGIETGKWASMKGIFPTAEPHPDAPDIPLDQNILERYNRSVRNFTPIEANSDERSRVYESLTGDARNEYQQNQYENIASGTFGYSDSSIHTPQYTGHCNPDVPDDLNDIVSGTLLIAWYVN